MTTEDAVEDALWCDFFSSDGVARLAVNYKSCLAFGAVRGTGDVGLVNAFRCGWFDWCEGVPGSVSGPEAGSLHHSIIDV